MDTVAVVWLRDDVAVGSTRLGVVVRQRVTMAVLSAENTVEYSTKSLLPNGDLMYT